MVKDDIAIAPTGLTDIKVNAGKPVYLLSLEDGTKTRSTVYFLSLKLDKHDNFIEFKGVPLLKLEDLKDKDPLSLIDSLKVQEICVPWSRVVQIKNLIFKSK